MQRTIKHLPEKLLAICTLIVPEEEEIAYKKHVSTVKIQSSPAKGISATRQWIMENIKAKYILFMDDDMQFGKRKNTKIVNCQPQDYFKMLYALWIWLEAGYLHVGISQHAGNNRIKEDYTRITRMNNTYAYNRLAVLKTGIRFDRLTVMEDFDVTLQLLELGYPNIVTYQYAWSQRKSGDVGGCSLYRNSATMQEAAKKLTLLHGSDIITIVSKKAKTTWNNMGNYRCDVKIAWKKAYQKKAIKTRPGSGGINNYF